MHARIYQVSKERVNKEDQITPDLFYEEDFLDYCGESEDFDEDIEYLVNYALPKGCFSREGEDAIRYNGGLEEVIAEWGGKISDMATQVRGLTESIGVENAKDKLAQLTLKIWQLKEVSSTPTEDLSRIWTEEDGTQTIGEWLLALARTLKEGDVIYIGGTVDFHY